MRERERGGLRAVREREGAESCEGERERAESSEGEREG